MKKTRIQTRSDERSFAEVLPHTINVIVILGFLILLSIVWMKGYRPFGPIKWCVFLSTVSVACGLLFCGFVLKKRVIIPTSRLSLAVLTYFLYLSGSVWYFPHTDTLYFWLLTGHFILVGLVSIVTDVPYRDYLLHTLILVAFIISLYSCFQFVGLDIFHFSNLPESRISWGKRVYGTFGNPVFLGTFYVCMLPIIGAFLIKQFQNGTLLGRVYLGVTFFLSVLALLMSQTRSAWLMSGASMSIFLLLFLGKRIGQFMVKYPWKTSLVVGIIVVLALFTGYLIHTHTTLTNWQGGKLRLHYFSNTKKMIQESPLFGRGLGTWNVYHPLFYDNRAMAQFGDSRIEQRLLHAHNEHLEQMSDGGMLGYAIFLWIVIEAIYALLQKNSIIQLGIAVALVGVLGDALFSPSLRFIHNSSVFWLFIGLANIHATRVSFPKQRVTKTAPKQPAYGNVLQGFGIAAIFVGIIIILSHAYGLVKADENMKTAMSLYRGKQYQQAIKTFERSLADNPYNKIALYYLGASYNAQNKPDEAIQVYRKLTQADPNFGRVNFHLAELFGQKHDTDRMLDYLKRHIAVNTMDWKAYYNLAVTEFENQKQQEGIQYLQEIEKIHAIRNIDAKYLDRVTSTLATFRGRL